MDIGKRYPVIYFLHGWSQRYFGPVGDDYSNYDRGSDNDGDNMAAYVASHDVIVVKLDGYNPMEENVYNLTPYNIGEVTTFRQFPVYFPEIVDYIDQNYRTLPDRNHRAVSGLSMGGFMCFWISGKYPHLVSAAGNFCGSPEFYVGPVNFPVEYRNKDMYSNYAGVRLRLHYGDKDNLRYYHQEMNNTWFQVMENYTCKIFDARHSTCGLGEMFDFLMDTFEDPPPLPEKWDHIDVYPEFSIWDYSVISDRFRPGFTILEEVNERGFKSSIREYLPDGTLIPCFNLSIQTPPIYEKNTYFVINDIAPVHPTVRTDTIQSDQYGRLKISLDGGLHHIGINRMVDLPNIVIAFHQLENMDYAQPGKKVHLSIKLLNKGMAVSEDLSIRLTATNNHVDILKGISNAEPIAVNEIKEINDPFVFLIDSPDVEIIKFKLEASDPSGMTWTEFFELDVKERVNFTENFAIADGRAFTVVRAGIDSVNLTLGKGNGNGVANPGETIEILMKDLGRYWRTAAYTADPNVNPFGIKLRRSDNWAAFDHVNGSAKITMPVISSSCQDGHTIEFYTEYWQPVDQKYHSRQTIRKKVRVRVSGDKDKTAPEVLWTNISGDNTLQVKMYDGAPIAEVRARLNPAQNMRGLDDVDLKEPDRPLMVQLNDKGINGDRIEGDFVFAGKIPHSSAYFYRLVVESTDMHGNVTSEHISEVFTVY